MLHFQGKSGIEATYKRYFSNSDKRFEGGLIDFDEYSLGIHKSFEKICDFRFNITGRKGNSTIYLESNCKLPKNAGAVSLGHDIVNYDYSNQANQYNMIKVGYTFPEIKRTTLSVATGYKYSGSDSGFDFSINLAYRTKSGRTINIKYQCNKTGGYIINNMYLPMNNRHSINITPE